MAYPQVGAVRVRPEGGFIIEIAVPDIDSVMDFYGTACVIQLQKASTATGSYSDDTSIALVAGTTFYSTFGTAAQYLVTDWWRYRFEDAAGTTVSAWSPVFTSTPLGITFGTIRQEAAKELGMYASGTATTMAVGAVTDTGKINTSLSTLAWQQGFIKITSGTAPASGTVRQISSFVQTTGVFNVTPAFATASGAPTYELYRDISPDDIDEAINDVLARLWIEDEYVLAGSPTTGEESRTQYALPYWVTSEADVIGVDRFSGAGDSTTERVNGRWQAEPVSTWHVESSLMGGYVIIFHWAPGANAVFRVRLLRPYIPANDLKITSDATVVNLPLGDIIPGVKAQVLDRLVNATRTNEDKREWESRRSEAQARWWKILRRYNQKRSFPVREQRQWVSQQW